MFNSSPNSERSSLLRPDPQRIGEVLHSLVRSEHWNNERDVAVVYDRDVLRNRIDRLRTLWPEATHCYAVKAAPLSPLLQEFSARGFGFEVASMGELEIVAETVPEVCPVIYDSPLKSDVELAKLLRSPVVLNLNDLDEVRRVAAMLSGSDTPVATIGLRINPGTGAGTIAETGVAAVGSQFGEPIEQRPEVLAAFERWPWLTGLHLHAGSQGMPVEHLIKSIKRVWDLGMTIEQECSRILGFFDVGGGLPAVYGPDGTEDPLDRFVRGLRAKVPGLFVNERRVFTEYGRSLVVNAGWTVSRVGRVGTVSGRHLAGIFFGADLALRECYLPDNWPHEWLAYQSDGTPPTGRTIEWDIHGPLCFAGDFPGRSVSLPESLAVGDLLVMRETGGYTLGMASRYNSRPLPAVFFWSDGRFDCLSKDKKSRDH